MSEEINGDRRRFLAAAAATVAAAQLGLERAAAAASEGGGELASLETATAWLNSAPLTAAGLRGLRRARSTAATPQPLTRHAHPRSR